MPLRFRPLALVTRGAPPGLVGLFLSLVGQTALAQPTTNPYDEPGPLPPAPATAPAAAPDGVDAAWLDEAAERADATPDAAAVDGTGTPTAPPTAPEAALAAELAFTNQVTQQESITYQHSVGANASDQFVLPSGMIEIGGELVLLTSDYQLGTDRIDLTDVGLLRLRMRRAIGRRLGLFAAAHLLAKQPQSVSEPVWQGALGGVVVPFGRWFAAEIGGGGGPLLGRDGAHYELGSQLLFKRPIDRFVRFELALGTATTALTLRPRGEAPFWFEQVTSHAQVAFGDEDEGGAWVGVAYGVPFARSPERVVWDGVGRRSLDVGTTLSLTLGAVVEVEDTGWELFTTLSVVDRGELEDPSTELPMLDGGFDQTQVTAGVQYRLERSERAERRRRHRRLRGPVTPRDRYELGDEGI